MDNTIIDKLNFYQSANSDSESIKKNFIVRIHEFELITEALKSKKGEDPLQHELILGRRGSGKSTLLKRLEIEINENSKLRKKYIPVNLAEEQASIYRLSDLWWESLQELQLRFKINIELRDFSDFSNNDEYTRYIYEEIKKLLESKNKKLVLLLDNFDRIIENLNDDGNLLREILLNNNNVQIIGGSTRMDEHFWKYDKPFYDFFRLHKLAALSFYEIHKLLNHWSKIMPLPLLKDYAIKNRGKIESIRILTDGLPRTLLFFIRILLTDNDIYGFQYITKIMDQATPLYQERLNNLTAPQRKIVLEIAFNWEAVSTKQLVNKSRMESKLISAYLKQLISFGIVTKLDTNTKNKLYRISERFFNMWLIVTQGNPNQKRKAKYLTIFLESWYDTEKITELAITHLEKLKTKRLSYDKASVITKSLSQSKCISTTMRDELIEKTKDLEQVKEPSANYLPEKSNSILKEFDKLLNEGKHTQAINKINQLENEEDGIKFGALGLAYHNKEEKGEAEKYYLLAVEKGYIKAMFNLAILYQEQEQAKEAEKYYLLAIENGNTIAPNNLASIYVKQGNLDKAEEYLLIAIEMKDINALHNLALVYLLKNENANKTLKLMQENTKTQKNTRSSIIILIIQIWNNIFLDIDKKMKAILNHGDNEDLSTLFHYLLIFEQKSLVLSYFESEKYGRELKDKYILYYYATLILSNNMDNKKLIMPTEVIPTVNEIVNSIKKGVEFYSES